MGDNRVGRSVNQQIKKPWPYVTITMPPPPVSQKSAKHELFTESSGGLCLKWTVFWYNNPKKPFQEAKTEFINWLIKWNMRKSMQNLSMVIF